MKTITFASSFKRAYKSLVRFTSCDRPIPTALYAIAPLNGAETLDVKRWADAFLR